jgi:hypothetical protein|tara:strand:- start:56 stop:334 length:279 start_codon:yes stop_codon:yes gene_type:complete
MPNIITAKYKSNQTLVNKLYKFERKYQELVNLWDHFDGENDEGQYNTKLNQIAAKQETAFYQQDEIYQELSATEAKHVERQYHALHGYGIQT